MSPADDRYPFLRTGVIPRPLAKGGEGGTLRCACTIEDANREFLHRLIYGDFESCPILATSMPLHTHRKVPIPCSFGPQLRDDNQKLNPVFAISREAATPSHVFLSHHKCIVLHDSVDLLVVA